MGYNNNVLIRDELGDDGSSGEHGGYCSSPDIISHEQVADPQTAFATPASYLSDPNQPLDSGSMSNCVYMRAKNLSSTAQTVYLRLYRAQASLFMRPSIWRNNRMSTLSGASYQRIDLAGSSIVAASSPFLLDAQASSNYCLLGIANDSAEETIPLDFDTYSAFVTWVRQTRAVGVRNMCLVGSTRTDFETLYSFSNPEANEKIITFSVTCVRVPLGTSIALECAPLGVSGAWSVAQDEQTFAVAGVTPAGFDGFAAVSAVLPDEVSTWPDDAQIDVKAYATMDESEGAYCFGVPFESVPGAAQELARYDAIGRLVLVGECSAVFCRC